MLSRGVHPKIVSERLGHASANITLDTYSHVLPGLQVAAAAQPDVSSLSLRPGLVSNPLARPIEAPRPIARQGRFEREMWWAVLDSNQ